MKTQLTILSLITSACISSTSCTPGNELTIDVPAVAAPRMTLIGTPLREPGWSPEVKARLEKDLSIAQAVMEVAPEREDSYIWLGRRYGYLARWSEAIDVFTRGLEKFPDSYKLLRYRGRHLARYREIDRAIADYKRAAELVADKQDSYEPDGILNARHEYLGSYRSNIHYYLGQTSFSAGDYEATLRGMERASAEPLVQHDDRLVATSYWRYLALRKLGRHDEARTLIRKVPQGLELVENFTYYKGVQFLQGVYTKEELMPEADSIIKFAIAMDHLFKSEQATAEAMWVEIIDGSAQGFWPAETELIAVHYKRP
jgi:tetratricopeptide (TPR) repeat protein